MRTTRSDLIQRRLSHSSAGSRQTRSASRPSPECECEERRPTGLEGIVPMALAVPTGTNEGSVAVLPLLHYRPVPSEENNKVFGRDQSFVAGSSTNIQFMVKDSKKYAATGGWGFGHFESGKPSTDEAMMKTCFACHQQMKARDLVFTRYAP